MKGGIEMATGKVFRSGDGQAVQLPRDFEFAAETHEVTVRRNGGALILEPVHKREWPAEFWQAFEGPPLELERPVPSQAH